MVRNYFIPTVINLLNLNLHLLPLVSFDNVILFATALWDHTKTVVDFSPDQTEATVLEMNPSTYNLRMFAKNRMSTSKASNVLTITTGETGVVFVEFNNIF